MPPIEAPLPAPARRRPRARRSPRCSRSSSGRRSCPRTSTSRPQRRSIVKPLVILLIIAILAAAAVIGSIVGLRRAHFVGLDPATGRVAVYEGVPFELTSSHTLYRKIYTSPTLYAAQLTAEEAARPVRPQAAEPGRRAGRGQVAREDPAITSG